MIAPGITSTTPTEQSPSLSAPYLKELKLCIGNLRRRINALFSRDYEREGYPTDMDVHAIFEEELSRIEKRFPQIEPPGAEKDEPQEHSDVELLLLVRRVVPGLDLAAQNMVCGAISSGSVDKVGEMVSWLSSWITSNKIVHQRDLLYQILVELEKELPKSKANPNGPADLRTNCEYTRTMHWKGQSKEIRCKVPALYVETEGKEKGMKVCQKHHCAYSYRVKPEDANKQVSEVPEKPLAKGCQESYMGKNTCGRAAVVYNGQGHGHCRHHAPSNVTVLMRGDAEKKESEPAPIQASFAAAEKKITRCGVSLSDNTPCSREAVALSEEDKVPLCKHHHFEYRLRKPKQEAPVPKMVYSMQELIRMGSQFGPTPTKAETVKNCPTDGCNRPALPDEKGGPLCQFHQVEERSRELIEKANAASALFFNALVRAAPEDRDPDFAKLLQDFLQRKE